MPTYDEIIPHNWSNGIQSTPESQWQVGGKILGKSANAAPE